MAHQFFICGAQNDFSSRPITSRAVFKGMILRAIVPGLLRGSQSMRRGG
jgi:hypothetical protein